MLQEIDYSIILHITYHGKSENQKKLPALNQYFNPPIDEALTIKPDDLATIILKDLK